MTQAKPSKTERKREQLALQELGERLIGLTAEELRALPLDDRLLEAVTDAAGMHARGALRRQKQLIGKLMRDADASAIRRALDNREAGDRLARRIFANAEAWRDRVIGGGAAVVAEFNTVVGTSETGLDNLIIELQSTVDERAASHLRRQIFRTIHAALMAQARNDRISP